MCINVLTQISGGVINTLKMITVPYSTDYRCNWFSNKILCHQPLIKQLIQNYDAPINECNYPVPLQKLEWIPNLFVRRMLCRLN